MKRVIFLIVISLVGTSLMFAQTLKIALLDMDRIMEDSKATQDAQTQFSAETEQWERELNKIDKEIQGMKTEFEARQLTLTEAGKTQAQERIDTKVLERRQFIENIFGESGKAMQRNAELLEPIMIELKDVIEKVALENDYSIIFDAVGGGVLYAKPGLDITELVIEGLDKSTGN